MAARCVKIEPNIDYYKDVAARGLLEVIPNWITKGLTDPRLVYAMRWITAKREAVGRRGCSRAAWGLHSSELLRPRWTPSCSISRKRRSVGGSAVGDHQAARAR